MPAGPGGYPDADAVITQLFYYTNVLHDFLESFGFDNASANFEGADPVLAEATDGYEDGVVTNCDFDNDTVFDDRCVNNANFNTPADGASPRMQNYLWETPQRDVALDGDVIAHEYGHGLSERLVGNGTLGGGLQAGSMGEGWGDVLSAYMWDEPVVGEYVSGNATTGIRIFSMAASTANYSQLCNMRGNGVCEVHDDGEIWAAALWDMRVKLVARYGASGENEAMQLMIDGLKATPLAPDFLDARDAILTADQTTNADANRCLIWGVFAARGDGVLGIHDRERRHESHRRRAMARRTARRRPSSLRITGTIEGTDEPLDGTGWLDGDPEGNALTYAVGLRQRRPVRRRDRCDPELRPRSARTACTRSG